MPGSYFKRGTNKLAEEVCSKKYNVILSHILEEVASLAYTDRLAIKYADCLF